MTGGRVGAGMTGTPTAAAADVTDDREIEPDMRFSLANERTALAWVRTCLGLIAAAAAVTHLVPERTPAWLTCALVVAFAAAAVLTGAAATTRFRTVHRALRRGQDYHPPREITVLATLLIVISVAVVIVSLSYHA